jgi:hypothetical protein
MAECHLLAHRGASVANPVMAPENLPHSMVTFVRPRSAGGMDSVRIGVQHRRCGARRLMDAAAEGHEDIHGA